MGGWCPKVNKFEQVSSDGNQMSLAGGDGAPCPVRFYSQAPKVSCPGLGWGGGLYNEVQCIMGNGHMGPSPCGETDRLMDRHVWKHYIPVTPVAGGSKQPERFRRYDRRKYKRWHNVNWIFFELAVDDLRLVVKNLENRIIALESGSRSTAPAAKSQVNIS